MSIVIDTSLAAAALIPSQRLADAATTLLSEQLFAPSIMRGEFYSAVLKLERRGNHDRMLSDASIAGFESLGIEHLSHDDWVPRAFAYARRHQHSVFDAIYLACAEDLDAELWTCDARFVRSFGADRPARLKLCPDDVPAV